MTRRTRNRPTTWSVRAAASWEDVERGVSAHESTHDTEEAADAAFDGLPWPIIDLIRHDETGGRVLRARRAVPYPAGGPR